MDLRICKREPKKWGGSFFLTSQPGNGTHIELHMQITHMGNGEEVE